MDQKKYFKLILIGDSGVGKSSLFHRVVFNKFTNEARPTTGTDFLSKTFYINNTVCNTQIWDTSGQEQGWCLTDVFWKTADAAILIYDQTQQDTFKRLDYWLRECKLKTNTMNGNNNSSKDGEYSLSTTVEREHIPFFVMGNKCDQEQKVSNEEIQRWCSDNDIQFEFKVSAKDTTGVKEAFLKVIEVLLENLNEKQDESQYNHNSDLSSFIPSRKSTQPPTPSTPIFQKESTTRGNSGSGGIGGGLLCCSGSGYTCLIQ